MKRFFIRVLVYLGIVLLCSALFLRVLVAFPNEYCRQSHEVNVIKQIERMKTINEPKIIIIGGSGCGFGLCSKLISEHFNMPVCNTGTHAGMGLITHINLCKEFVHDSDIVVVIPEYSQYLGNRRFGDVAALRILTSLYPKGYKYFTFQQQIQLLQHVPSAHKDAMSARGRIFDEDSPYSQKSLNEYGDVEMYEMRCHKTDKDWEPKKWERTKVEKESVALLQGFYNYCEKHHAKMLLFPPAYKAMNFDVNENTIHSIWSSLEEAQLPCISAPERYKMVDTMHYDTEYHLTYEGVMIRTKRLIADMDSALRDYNNAQY